ncbi:hypothetical protein HIM_06072 [Hirsutella minnesotensis 3608]|uniref:DUF7907 domain-containing protein n=1 Tax=Hirsutella minnesotensis 3608 TaxID=1043627 RepID=A0A0F7ZJJ7_9HYPO|nr:hypothetical protein HIM_06072 [Hirsutella minnesotensis 3608]
MITAAIICLLGLAAAKPLAADATAKPRYPQASKSRGFHLVVNVTDRSRDFSPPIQNTYVASIHTGAGLALVGNVRGTDNARIFYQNGTAEERRSSTTTVITDSGTPSFPSGVQLVKDKDSDFTSTAHLDAGPGTRGVRISRSPESYAYLLPETWLACNESLPYYQGKYFIIFKQSNSTVDGDGNITQNIPDRCAPVRLIPQCTKLNDLAKGSYSSHLYAIEDRCYKDVKSIKWSDFGP